MPDVPQESSADGLVASLDAIREKVLENGYAKGRLATLIGLVGHDTLDESAVASVNSWLSTVRLISSPAVTAEMDPETTVVLFEPVLISTMNDVPGHVIETVIGEVYGLTVRSRGAFPQLGANLKAIVGGELAGMTKLLASSRDEVTERVVEAARQRKANAVVAFRFDTSEIGGSWTEICAYGTAVRISPRRHDASQDAIDG